MRRRSSQAGKARVAGPPPPTHARRLAAARSAHARWLRPHPPIRGSGRGAGPPRRASGGGPERPTRNWPLAALVGLGLRSRAAVPGAVESRCPSAWTIRTSGSDRTPAPGTPNLITLAWPCLFSGSLPAAERLGTPLCDAAS
ncbi:hypothetical protein NN561_014213 [Cricetulus griseus]